jgi:hypothetical protein
MNSRKFDIILSKNRIAKEMRRLYTAAGEKVPEMVLFDFTEVEKRTGTMNQPTGVDILTAKIDI